jgi:hypothetical protein
MMKDADRAAKDYFKVPPKHLLGENRINNKNYEAEEFSLGRENKLFVALFNDITSIILITQCQIVGFRN